MRDAQKSWRYFGLLLLVLIAGAIRIETEKEQPRVGWFRSETPLVVDPATGCDSRLDPAWIGNCLHPDASLLARR